MLIKKCLWFDSIQNLVVHTNGAVTTLDNEFLGQLDGARRCYRVNEWDVLILDDRNQPYLLSLSAGTIESLGTFRVSDVYGELLLTYTRSSPRVYGVFSMDTRSFIYETENYLGECIRQAFIVAIDNTAVSFRELATGKSIFSVTTNEQISDFLMLDKDRLLLAKMDGELQLFDIPTNRQIDCYFDTGVIRGLHLDTNMERVYGLNHHSFVEIDTKNGALIRNASVVPHLASFPKRVLSITHSLLRSGSLLLIADFRYLGIFSPIDLSTDLILEIPFGDKNSFIPIPGDCFQASRNGVFVLDDAGTLYRLDS